jgi:hypothetical protein
LWSDLEPLEWLLRKMEDDVHMQPGTWLVSRALTEAAGPWDVRLTTDDDGEYFSRVISACERIKFVPGARMYYRITGGNTVSHVGESARKAADQLTSCRSQIANVLRLQDSSRSRRACITYLQKYMTVMSYHPQLAAQARAVALELGGELKTPELPEKLKWLQRLVGWELANRARRYYNRIKWGFMRSYDHARSKMQ